MQSENKELKLSKRQREVVDFMRDGWELLSDTVQIGFVGLVRKGYLKRKGVFGWKNVNIRTVDSLVRKGVINRLDNPYVMTQFTKYELIK